jgi:hypothetical protein
VTDILRGREWRNIYTEQLHDQHHSRIVCYSCDQIDNNEAYGLPSKQGENKRCIQCSGSETCGEKSIFGRTKRRWKAVTEIDL